MHDRMKEPWNRVYHGLAPDSQAQQYGGRHGSPRVSSNWRFDQEYESPRGRAAGDLERIPFSLLGKDFRRQQRLRRERKQVVWKREDADHPSCEVVISWWSLVAIRAEEKVDAGGPYHISRWGESFWKQTAWHCYRFDSCLWISLWKSNRPDSFSPSKCTCVGWMKCHAPHHEAINFDRLDERHMLPVFKSVSLWKLNFNGIPSHPKSIIFHHSTHRTFSRNLRDDPSEECIAKHVCNILGATKPTPTPKLEMFGQNHGAPGLLLRNVILLICCR